MLFNLFIAFLRWPACKGGDLKEVKGSMEQASKDPGRCGSLLSPWQIPALLGLSPSLALVLAGGATTRGRVSGNRTTNYVYVTDCICMKQSLQVGCRFFFVLLFFTKLNAFSQCLSVLR